MMRFGGQDGKKQEMRESKGHQIRQSHVAAVITSACVLKP